jgi:hypothetical protein
MICYKSNKGKSLKPEGQTFIILKIQSAQLVPTQDGITTTCPDPRLDYHIITLKSCILIKSKTSLNYWD